MKRFAVSSWLFVACALAANAAMAAMGVVQLWEGGPYWAESNLGESEDAGHPEYGGFYSVDNAAAEVAKLGEGWRLPNKGELEALMNDDYCDRTWTTRNGVEGYLFSDKTDPSKSVFLPAAGCDDGGGRSSAGEKGLYWSSTRFDVYGTYHLDFGFERHDFPLERSHGVSVRAVRDAPLVTIDEVGSVEPWDRAKGAVTVDYSLAWLDATIKYKVVFDISANGKTASITNDAVNLPEGSRTQTIETVKAFGNETLSRDAKVKVSLIAVKPKSPDGQLWAGGPVWAACNVGATTPGDLGISTNWYDTVWAVADIMGSSWRVPTFEDLLALRDRCTVNWATCKNINGEDVKGFRLQGKGGCSSNSIFLPCAFYWSSTGLGDEQAISMTVIDHLQIDSFNPRSFLGTIRALRDATPEWQEVFEATAEERLSLGVAEVVLPTGMTGYGYAVSNLTVGVEIPPAEPDGSNYALPLGAKVGIYAVAEARYVISAVDPLVIDTVTGHTKVEVDDLPVPTVYAPGSKENPWIVTVGNFPRGTTAWTSGDGAVTNAVREGVFTVPDGTANVKVFFTAKPGYELVGETVVDLGTVTVDVTFGSGSGYKLPSVRTLPVEYVDADGVVREKAFGEFTKVTASTKKLADGKWYAVIDDVTLTNSLPVEGSAHLILCDWATLAITNSTADAAIPVGSGASLTIYGQTADTGRLAVSGGNAGIGGKTSGECGSVTIHGGTISASAMSNKYCAGIGSGNLGSGGSVTITGGRITAQGGTGAEDIGNGANAKSPCAVAISGGIFARPVQDVWLTADCAVIANQDEATAAAYPWAVVMYPDVWPAADDAVKAKFGAWRNGAGADADLDTDDAQKAFLLNVAVTGIKELKIESIEVDAEGYATIVVSAPGAFFFDRINLGEINGILSIMAGKTLETMTPKAVAYWTTTNGKAMIKVKENFIRAVLGFKTPDVAADTLQPEQGVAK